MRNTGLLLILAGAFLLLLGVTRYFGLLENIGRLGRLPGDIYVDRENLQLYLPITTSVLISAVVTLFLLLFARLR